MCIMHDSTRPSDVVVSMHHEDVAWIYHHSKRLLKWILTCYFEVLLCILKELQYFEVR